MESLAITNVNQKHIYWILGMSILLLFGGFLLIRISPGIEKGSLFQKFFNPKNNSNITTLEKLNEEWNFPDEYTMENILIGEMDAYWVYANESATDKVILQLHGGAYINSLAENGTQYERAAVKYAEISGARILTIDYRVAPEDPYPAALEDAVTAYQWLLEKGYEADNIIIVGDSAGGGLTLATTMYLRDHQMPMPAALITMSAWTDLNYKNRKISYVGEYAATDPYISPIYGDYTGFPSMLMQVGQDEKLLKDTIKVAEKAKAADVKVTQTTYDKMFHVFQLLYPVLTEANDAWEEVGTFIQSVFAEKS